MEKHTPGPWRVDKGCYAVRADALPLKAETGMDSGVVCTAVNSTADARLIDAAPDLLAELQNIANAVPSKWDPDVRDQFQQWAQSRARYAIAKATVK